MAKATFPAPLCLVGKYSKRAKTLISLQMGQMPKCESAHVLGLAHTGSQGSLGWSPILSLADPPPRGEGREPGEAQRSPRGRLDGEGPLGFPSLQGAGDKLLFAYVKQTTNVMEHMGFCCPHTHRSLTGFLPSSPPKPWGWKPGNCSSQTPPESQRPSSRCQPDILVW